MIEKKPYSITSKVIAAIIGLGLIDAIVFTIPYIKYTFYYGMIEMTGCTNEQLGLLMTIYGLGEVFALPIGGILAERYDSAKVLLVSTIGTGLLCFLLVIHPSYATTALVWFLLIFTSLFMFWGALFKAMRLLGPANFQGRINGLYYGAAGIGYFVINMSMVPVYDHYAKITDGMGMRAVFVFFGLFCFAVAIFCYFALKAAFKEQKENGWEIDEDDTAPVSLAQGLKGFIEQCKECFNYKCIWVFGIALFCVYGGQIAITYTTSFFTDVLGIAVTFGVVLSVIRSYGMQMLGGPLGGWLADKWKSPSKVVMVGNVVAIVCLLFIVVFPRQSLTLPLLMVIVMVLALFNCICYGINFAIPAEGKMPARLQATAIGFGSAIGYIPDVFEHTMFGAWLDKRGNDAYNSIFIFGIILEIIAFVLLIWFLKSKKENKLVFKNAETAELEEDATA